MTTPHSNAHRNNLTLQNFIVAPNHENIKFFAHR
jgi:hypothetical protein